MMFSEFFVWGIRYVTMGTLSRKLILLAKDQDISLAFLPSHFGAIIAPFYCRDLMAESIFSCTANLGRDSPDWRGLMYMM